MEKFRTHIARWLVALLVISGFSFSLVQPAQARQNTDAFARWLDMMAKSSDTAALQEELKDLQASGEALSVMIQEASRIVSQNNENFDFPFAKEEAPNQLYQLLLIEWNQFQTGDAMAAVPATQKSIKQLLPWHTDKLSPPGFLGMRYELFQVADNRIVVEVIPGFQESISLQPMSSGVAIGAP
ncbi:hypothetical protein [Fodinibius salsisoli]|uniref:Uncharacterized protein n=1 Tax=Fodinibius salsisoli TaxID=2820877 RepID=A0ABT3PME0_9BACT|nr:hypothetical protein [Fodinibius salsisoli]MCW9707115.1 hypothetical protein [Fodinibius salsisoli]